MNARLSSLFAVLVVLGLLLSACAPAATPTAAPQFQPPTGGNAAPAKPAQPAMPAAPAAQPTQAARATSAPAAEAPKLQPPADANGLAPQAPAAQAPSANQPCCAPTPWPTYPPQREYPQTPFMDAREDHLSTFAMDVDTASYTKMRDYIRRLIWCALKSI